jgi:hypothetical protein
MNHTNYTFPQSMTASELERAYSLFRRNANLDCKTVSIDLRTGNYKGRLSEEGEREVYFTLINSGTPGHYTAMQFNSELSNDASLSLEKCLLDLDISSVRTRRSA